MARSIRQRPVEAADDRDLRPWTIHDGLDKELNTMGTTLQNTLLMASPQRLPGIVKVSSRVKSNRLQSSLAEDSSMQELKLRQGPPQHAQGWEKNESPESLDADPAVEAVVNDFNSTLQGYRPKAKTYRSKKEEVKIQLSKKARERDRRMLQSVKYVPKFQGKATKQDDSSKDSVLDADEAEIANAIRQLLRDSSISNNVEVQQTEKLVEFYLQATGDSSVESADFRSNRSARPSSALSKVDKESELSPDSQKPLGSSVTNAEFQEGPPSARYPASEASPRSSRPPLPPRPSSSSGAIKRNNSVSMPSSGPEDTFNAKSDVSSDHSIPLLRISSGCKEEQHVSMSNNNANSALDAFLRAETEHPSPPAPRSAREAPRPTSSGHRRPQSASSVGKLHKGTTSRFEKAQESSPALAGLTIAPPISSTPPTTAESSQYKVFGRPKLLEVKPLSSQLLTTAGSANVFVNPENVPNKLEAQRVAQMMKQIADDCMERNKADHTWGILCTPGFVEAIGAKQVFTSECHAAHSSNERMEAALRKTDLTNALQRNDITEWAENAIKTGRKLFTAGGSIKV